jgi:lipopolysaccharide/colanic/teichoic acid biosynthesis glycosyltransferase
MWQVKGRRSKNFEGWIEGDIVYVERRSVALDVILLWKTIRVALSRAEAG